MPLRPALPGKRRLRPAGEYSDPPCREGELLLSFGKHKGRPINQVDDGYLQWMLKYFPESSPWRKAAADALTGKVKEQREKKSTNALLAELKSCSMRRELQWGRRIHAKALEMETGSNLQVATALIKMYGKCASMVDARQVFDSIKQPNLASWTALLLGYAENGQGRFALELFSRMKVQCAPDSVTYIAALKACTSLAMKGDDRGKEDCLQRGRQVHSEIGGHLDLYVQNTLIDMYVKCGSMVDARRVFDGIEHPDVVSWTAMVLGYAENGEGAVALELFSKMKAQRCVPNSVTYIAACKACASLAVKGDDSGLEFARQIHSEIGGDLDHQLRNTLIDMYAKYGSMVDAHRVFNDLETPDVVSWTVLLLGYVENGEALTALELFSKMKVLGCAPDSVTYIGVLKACSLLGALALGRKVHAEISEFTTHLVTCLVDFYGKCGSMVEAREVFEQHSTRRNLATWNALLAGYGSFGSTASVFGVFEAMQDVGLRPDALTFVHMLQFCSHAGLVQKARHYLEAMPVKYGVTPTVMHYNCMVDALGRANQLTEAIAVLQGMPCSPDAVTWTALLCACHKWKNVEIGRMAFQSLVDMGHGDASSYVLMAHTYGRARMKSGALKLQGQQAYVADEVGRIVAFVAGEPVPPEVEQLSEAMQKRRLCLGKEEVPCEHCGRRAIVYGMLKTPPSELVRVVKNIRMCENCHEYTKMLSKSSGRAVMFRDASRMHVVEDGCCSCGDYW